MELTKKQRNFKRQLYLYKKTNILFDMNSLELKDKKEQLKRKAQAIINKCKKEVRDLTEEEEQEQLNRQEYTDHTTQRP